MCVSLALGLAIAGCTGPNSAPDPEPEADPGPTAHALVDPDAEAPAEPVEQAANGGTITVLSSRGAPSTFDPARISGADALAISRLMMRSLTQYQYRDGEMVLVPDLATDLGQPNEDFTRWEFTLRDGIFYSDGTPITAGDLAYAIERQFATEELPGGPAHARDYLAGGASYPGPFAETEGNGDGTDTDTDTGDTDGSDGTGDTGDDEADGDEDADEAGFAGVEAPDDRTLVVDLRRPFADFPYFAAHPAFSPVPAEADPTADGGTYGRNPLATGPYKIEKYVSGGQLVLTRNEHWNAETDTTRHQHVDRWVFDFGRGRSGLQERILEADAAEETDHALVVPDEVLADLVGDFTGAAQDRLLSGPARCVSYLAMDPAQIPLEVRRAVAAATPTAELVEASGRVPGVNWSRSASLLPPAMPGQLLTTTTGNDEDTDIDPGNGDPNEAKKLLEAADALAFELSFYVESGNARSNELAEIRREAYERAGFTVEPIEVPAGELAGAERDDPEGVNLRPTTWCPDWPTGSAVLPVWWDPRRDPEAGGNPWPIDDPEVIERIEQASGLEGADGLLAWGELDQYLMEEHQAVVPLGAEDVTALVGPSIGNARIDTTTSRPDYTGMFIEP